jgi:formylglycine-generating enzyme required for sulfatase activity
MNDRRTLEMDKVDKVLHFDRFALDLTRGSLRVGDREIDLPPKPFAVLRCLATNAGRLVSKQELLDAVWPNISVSDDSLVQSIREIREKLGDDSHRLIKTVPRRGYLLDCDVSPTPRTVPREPRHLSGHRPESGVHSWPQGLNRVTLGAAALGLAGLVLATSYTLGRLPTRDAAVERPSRDASAAFSPRPSFRDCDLCPEMVEVPAGVFMMGAAEDELGRRESDGRPRRVTIARPFAIGRYEVTVDEFATFVSETSTVVIKSLSPCQVALGFDRNPPAWVSLPDASFRRPGFDVTGRHPAGCISWYDAQAYVSWLRRRTGKEYRLPTEAEWEYAARAGSGGRYGFGGDETLLCQHARFADLATEYAWRDGCRSKVTAAGPTPVGGFKPNQWGLFDMHGNVSEWVEDCWTADPSENPTDGSAFTRADKCEMAVVRSGSFLSNSEGVRSAHRTPGFTPFQLQSRGFRVALTLN